MDLDPNNPMTVRNCIIYKCGTTSDLFGDWLGAIDIHGSERFPMHNITFENIHIIDSQTDGIQLWGGNIENITFKNVLIDGIGKGFQVTEKPRPSFDINAHSGTGSANFINVTANKVNNENNGYILNFK